MKKKPAATEITTSVTSSANSTRIGRFPKRVDTVIAQVLADLLDGKRLTGMEAVFGASTTRLAAHVNRSRSDYGWEVKSIEKVTGTNDGRVQEICEYVLSPDVIEAAFEQCAREWINRVRAARRARRAKAAEARRIAERANAAARRRQHPGQFDMFAEAR